MSYAPATANIAEAPHGHEDPRTFMFRLTLIASLGGLLFGFDTGVIAGALAYLREDFRLTVVTEGLLVTSLLLPAATAGALLGGPVADRLGRKKSLVIARQPPQLPPAGQNPSRPAGGNPGPTRKQDHAHD